MPAAISAIEISQEYISPRVQNGYVVPSADELVRICSGDVGGFPKGLAYPDQQPFLWIKYGHSVIWNEVPAQVFAHNELLRLGSPVRVPELFYACRIGHVKYIVMEYIAGAETAGNIIEHQPARTEEIHRLVALALQEMLRIPVPPNTIPSALDNSPIRNPVFDLQEASQQYQSVAHMQAHFNEFLRVTKKKVVIQNLELEPMVFCYGDVWPLNFLLDSHGRITVVDFADASFLPSSFAKWVLERDNRFNCDMTKLVNVPAAEGVDNVNALCAISGRIVIASGTFDRIFQRIVKGKDGWEVQKPAPKRDI